MKSAIYSPVLVLNTTYEAVAICAARRALNLIVKGRARTVEYTSYKVWQGIHLPTVIRLNEYAKIPYRIQVLTRRNILTRDSNSCQYCGNQFPAMELTLDHVIPRSKGGLSTWENLVAACSTCNRRKADKSCEEAGMPLLRRPRPVTLHTARHVLRSHGETEKAWQKYLHYDNEGSRETVLHG
jgi:5-methylcytosine-specific restriction endonuclease McrA